MTTIRWESFPGDVLECSGLPWFEEHLPNLWRLPVGSPLPDGVQRQARFPSGVRLRMCSNTSNLRFWIRSTAGITPNGFDVYVDGRFWHTAPVPRDSEGEVVCFTDAGHAPKEITIYLPLRYELQIERWGIDSDAVCGKPAPFINKLPFVLYGSSVAQGIGTARPGMSYAAILGRAMQIDYVNLGFGGAGRAEAEVVSLVTRIDACCYLLDLGKSYGLQTSEAYISMLRTLRQDHPGIPIICITPIFSSRELYDNQYVKLSRHTRAMMRESVEGCISEGDRLLVLIEGETLLSPQDTDALNGDGIHPNDLGHLRIAERLQTTLEDALRATESTV